MQVQREYAGSKGKCARGKAGNVQVEKGKYGGEIWRGKGERGKGEIWGEIWRGKGGMQRLRGPMEVDQRRRTCACPVKE